MKKQILNKQYNFVAKEFQIANGEMNKVSAQAIIKALKLVLQENITKALDFGSGLGDLISYFQSLGIECAGVDSSKEMVTLAKQQVDADIRIEDITHTSFDNCMFDLITSKWVIQTVPEIDPIYQEAYRLLRSGGYIVFLTVHPLRQFLEKKKQGKDYFKKEVVDSIIFDGAINVHEPSHTLKEYLSETFLKLFTLIGIDEGAEFPAAEQIGGDIYPTYLIIVAQKK